VISDIRFLSW